MIIVKLGTKMIEVLLMVRSIGLIYFFVQIEFHLKAPKLRFRVLLKFGYFDFICSLL